MQLQKYDKQIADIGKGTTTATSDILVAVSSKMPVQAECITLSYVVRDASWFLTYDIRAKDVNSPIRISHKANVSQHSGEEWKNIRLTLSTGNPSASGSKPSLNPYFLGYGMYYSNPAAPLTKVSGKVIGNDDKMAIVGATVKVKGTSIGAVTDANGNYTLQLPHDAQALVVSYIGYTPNTVPVNSEYVNVALDVTSNALNEVVVTGYSSQRKRDMRQVPLLIYQHG